MKKSVFIAALLLAGGAFADSTEVTTDCVVGVLPVNVPADRLEIILSVPWVEPGGGDAIAVSNFVKTASLTPGIAGTTTLALYDPDTSDFAGWNLVSNLVDGVYVNHWDEAGSYGSDEPVAKQGDAIILGFTNATTKASTVYLVGQVGTRGIITNTIAKASSETSPTFTLLAPPCGRTTPIDLNDVFASENIVEGCSIDPKDEITVDIISGLPARYIRKEVDSAWKWVFVYTGSAENAVIPAGRGFWYKRCGTTDLKIKWTAPSVSGS